MGTTWGHVVFTVCPTFYTPAQPLRNHSDGNEMPSKHERERIRLFEKYSTNLELVDRRFEGKYVCPICLSVFKHESVFGPEPLLTVEHCIPNRLGRRLPVLTCSKCNSTAGHKTDDELHKRVRFEDAWKPTDGKKIHAFMEFEGEQVAVDFRRTAKDGRPKIEAVIKSKGSSDASIDRLKQKIEEKIQENVDFEFKLKFNTKVVPNLLRSHIALLKSAYLLMFRHFGYGYIYTSHLDLVRQQILNPEQDLVPLKAIVFDLDIDKLPNSISAVDSPEELDAYLVPIPLTKYGIGKMVALPSHSGTYARWQTRHTETNGAQVQLNFSSFIEMDLSSPTMMLIWQGNVTQFCDLTTLTRDGNFARI